MSARRPVVAIAGGTGNLGAAIARAFLLPKLKVKFNDVIILTRSTSSSTANGLAEAGATLRSYDEKELSAALEGVDVVVNAVGPTGHHFKEKLLRALSKTNVKVYFPSEFGVDHYIHDFAHEEWDAKKRHYRLSTELLRDTGIIVCRVYAGLFLEDSIGPWFGFDTKNGKYEVVGDPDQATSYTSVLDVGKALAVLASQPPDKIPVEIHLNGNSKSFEQIANIMSRHSGNEIEVSSVPLADYKQGVLEKPSPTPERYLRFLMAEGKIDHTANGLGNNTDLFDNVAGFEGWKSMEDLAQDTSGKPWRDSEWPSAS